MSEIDFVNLLMLDRPIWTPDTSAINCLADDPESGPLIVKLTAGFHARFSFTSISEVVSNADPGRRWGLLELCRRLLGSGDCLEPPHAILRRMVESFEGAAPFDWRTVYVRFLEAQDQIASDERFDDDLAKQAREESRANNDIFEEIYSNSKPEFEALTARGAAMPVDVAEFVARMRSGPAFWATARNLYARAAKRPFDDGTIRRFYEGCDPFRALMGAIFAALYDRCVRPRNVGPSLRAGRNDTFMAVYLPYCHQFVTNDLRQLECYRGAVSVAGLDTDIRSYEQFRRPLVLGATSSFPL